MKGLIQKINDSWMVVSDQRTWQDPSAEDLIIPLHIDDLWVINHTGYVLGKNQELDFEILTLEEGITDCGNHIIYKDYAKLTSSSTKKQDMTPSEILIKHEDANEYHFHEVDRKWIIEAMEEYAGVYTKAFLDDFKIYDAAKEFADRYKPVGGTEFEMSAFIMGAQWYREQVKTK